MCVTADMTWKEMIQKMRKSYKKPFYICWCQTAGPWGRTGCVQCCHVSNGDHLSRKTRASRGRIAWLSLLPCLPVIPVLDALKLHQMGPSEQPPGGFLGEKTEGRHINAHGHSKRGARGCKLKKLTRSGKNWGVERGPKLNSAPGSRQG